MNTRLSSIGLALLISVAGPAWSAAPGPGAVEIVATSAAKLAAEALLAQPNGNYLYEMSNGRSLRVTPVGDGLIVQYGRRQLAQLQHDGQGRFISSDGRFVMRFGLDEEGQPYAVSLSLPAALA